MSSIEIFSIENLESKGRSCQICVLTFVVAITVNNAISLNAFICDEKVIIG